MNAAFFYAVVFLSNIIQGITGFAGTILALPFGIMLVGFDTAKPILNLLGILAPCMVLFSNIKKVRWNEFLIVAAFMIPFMALGIFLGRTFSGNQKILYRTLGIFVILLAAARFYGLVRESLDEKKTHLSEEKYAEHKKELGAGTQAGSVKDCGKSDIQERPFSDGGKKSSCGGNDVVRRREKYVKRGGLFFERARNFFLLVAAGVVHGMFVSGGPLLVGYLSKRLGEKDQFRSTISLVWILLNSLILFSDIHAGFWRRETVIMGAASVPFMVLGVALGGFLCKKMSQKLFLVLTYILFIVSGVSLILK